MMGSLDPADGTFSVFDGNTSSAGCLGSRPPFSLYIPFSPNFSVLKGRDGQSTLNACNSLKTKGRALRRAERPGACKNEVNSNSCRSW